MSYIVKIYLDSEKIPDEPYFTKEIFETQKDILQGVASGQITFVNKSKGEEELNEPIRE